MTSTQRLLWSEEKDPLLLPFEKGFRREIVKRSSRARCNREDVYYYTQNGKRLRSIQDISLKVKPDMGLTADNFTFIPCEIYHPPHEIIRPAMPLHADMETASNLPERSPDEQEQLKKTYEGHVDVSILNHRNREVFKDQHLSHEELVVKVERLSIPHLQAQKNTSHGKENQGKRSAFNEKGPHNLTCISPDKTAQKPMFKEKENSKRKPSISEAPSSKALCKNRNSKASPREAGPKKIKKRDQHSIMNFIKVSKRKEQEVQMEEKNEAVMTATPRAVERKENTKKTQVDCSESEKLFKTLLDTGNSYVRRVGCLNPVAVHFRSRLSEADGAPTKAAHEDGPEKNGCAEKSQQKENRGHKRKGKKKGQKGRKACQDVGVQAEGTTQAVEDCNMAHLSRETHSVVLQDNRHLPPLRALQGDSSITKSPRRKTLEDFGFAQKKENLRQDLHCQDVKNSCTLSKPLRSLTGNKDDLPAVISGADTESRARFAASSELSPSDVTEIRTVSQAYQAQDESTKNNAQVSSMAQLLYPTEKERGADCVAKSQADMGIILSHAKSAVLEEEIKLSRNVMELRDRHLLYLFSKCMPEMEGIMKKEVYSWRNNDYYVGGKTKRMLTYKIYPHVFSEEQISLISDMLIDEYVIKRKVTCDYLHQVLLPEFLVRVYMATNGTSHEESDRLMAATPVANLHDVPTHL